MGIAALKYSKRPAQAGFRTDQPARLGLKERDATQAQVSRSLQTWIVTVGILSHLVAPWPQTPHTLNPMQLSLQQRRCWTSIQRRECLHARQKPPGCTVTIYSSLARCNLIHRCLIMSHSSDKNVPEAITAAAAAESSNSLIYSTSMGLLWLGFVGKFAVPVCWRIT